MLLENNYKNMNKFKKTIFPVLLVALLVIVSGCGNKPVETIDNEVAVPSKEQNNNQREEIKQEEEGNNIAVELLIEDIGEWTLIEDKTAKITFEYPERWSMSEKDNKKGKKNIFTDKFSPDFRFILETPAYATGFELHKIIETKFYKTNDKNTDLHFDLLKSEHNMKDTLIVITWQEGSNSNNWQDGIINGKEGSSGFIMINFKDINQEYYLYIIDRFLESFKLIE
jgi:hypothetical protein